MSYADDPESNPYAAPVSDIAVEAPGQPAEYVGYAGFWRRFAAYFIDGILLRVVNAAWQSAVLAVVNANNNREQLLVIMALNVVISIGISVGYFAGMESSSTQATLGKMALGIKVTDLYGRRISFLRAVGRLAGKFVSALILMLGFIMAGFTEKKQGLHDMMAGTLVLKTR